MAFDWNANDSQYAGFKDYADNGCYEAVATEVELRKLSEKFVKINISFEETERFVYPRAQHTILTSKEGFNMHINKDMMMVLGASEEAAKKACETCILGKTLDESVNLLEQAYKKLLQKKPKLQIEVYQAKGRDGKTYTHADLDYASVLHDDRNRYDSVAAPDADVAASAEAALADADQLDLDSIPF